MPQGEGRGGHSPAEESLWVQSPLGMGWRGEWGSAGAPGRPGWEGRRPDLWELEVGQVPGTHVGVKWEGRTTAKWAPCHTRHGEGQECGTV